MNDTPITSVADDASLVDRADRMVRRRAGPVPRRGHGSDHRRAHRRSGGPADRGDGGGGPRQLVATAAALVLVGGDRHTVDDVPVGPAALRPVPVATFGLTIAAGSAGRARSRRGSDARRRGRPVPLCGLSVVVLGVDILTGASLQLSTVFGYSPIVAGRFAGYGNQAFSILTISSLVVAGTVGDLGRRRPTRRRRSAGGRGGGVPGGDRARRVPAVGRTWESVLASIPALAVCILDAGDPHPFRLVALIAAVTVGCWCSSRRWTWPDRSICEPTWDGLPRSCSTATGC